MEIFFTLILKLIPFYLFILLGFIAGRVLKVQKESIAPLLIYIITPMVIFNGAVTTQITWGALVLPAIFFLVASALCILVYKIAERYWSDSTKNILAFAAGSGNTGYFGIPVAAAILGERAVGLVVLCVLGNILYENSIGFFITARGHHTVRESIIKIICLPSIYTFVLGLYVNLSNISMGPIYDDTVVIFRGAYTLLGMMLIGLGLADVKDMKFDWHFTGFAFFNRFLIWPAMMLVIIFLDLHLFRLFDPYIHKVLVIMSVVPLAANTVAYATQLRAQPEKASLAVLLSTIFALFYIPLIVAIFLK